MFFSSSTYSAHQLEAAQRSMVGKPVRVQFGERGESFVGRLTEFNEDDGKHKVEYTDGDVKWHDLMSDLDWSEVSEADVQAEVAALRGK